MNSEKIKENFISPHNMGFMENPDGVGRAGNGKCGDVIEIYVKIKDGIIKEAGFNAFNCGSAVAVGSVATDMILGKSIEYAMSITKEDIYEALDGIEYPRSECSNIADIAIKNAIRDYCEKNNKEYEDETF